MAGPRVRHEPKNAYRPVASQADALQRLWGSFRRARVNVRHAAELKISLGPCGSLESRTATTPRKVSATSTQAPFCWERLLCARLRGTGYIRASRASSHA
jgi:hypothetical protein